MALYYGSDGDGAGRTYVIDDLRANGDGRGAIQVNFGSPTSLNRGSLDHIRICANTQRLDFEFVPAWLGRDVGPFVYRLRR